MKQKNESAIQLTVYYDGLCVICAREIAMYQRHKRAARIKFIDITSSQFDPLSHGLDARQIHRQFHVKTADGKILAGVPSFVAIWQTLEILKPLAYVAQTRIGGALMNLGYLGFTRIRPFLPRRKDCDDGNCQI